AGQGDDRRLAQQLGSVLRAEPLPPGVRIPQHGLRVGDGVGAVCHRAAADAAGVPRVEKPGLLRGAEGVTTETITRASAKTQAERPAPLAASRARMRSASATSSTQKSIAYAILILGSLIFLIPFYFLLNASFKTDIEAHA